MASQPPAVANALTNFDPKAGIPAHLQAFFEREGANIVPRQTVNSLGLTGKVWTLSVGGTKTPLQKRNDDGDLEPLGTMKVIVLDYAKQRARAYYKGAYDPAKTSQPTCWSDDGIAPDESLPGPFAPGTVVEEGKSYKISATCANCPMAVKGSRVIEGTNKTTTACAQHLLTAVLPDPSMGLPPNLMKPLRLKLAMTSIWDAESPEQEQQGWLSFDKYMDWLASRGCPNSAGVVTKMKFDTNAAFPKIFFSSERAVTADELTNIVVPLIHDPETKKLLGREWTPAGVEGVPVEEQETASPQPAAGETAPPAAVPAAASAPPGYQMAPGEAPTYESYRTAGWTDDQLIANGKLIAVAAPTPEPEVVAAQAPPPVQEAAVVVGEPAPAASAVHTETPVVAQPSVTVASPEAVVVVETVTSAPQQPAAPAVVQESAQATAPPPQATTPSPEPPAAAAAAAAATPAVSTDVPEGLAAIMAEWDPAAAPAPPAS